MVYSREIDDRDLTFGVSGMLYKNNLLMYDHQTESLWLQVKHTAVTGPMTGAKLTVLPSSLTTWEKWRRAYPDTMVLSLDTGYDRNYAADPYADYYKSRRILFGFARNILQGHDAKELIAGVRLAENSKAYPIDDLRKHGTITDRLGGLEIVLKFDPQTDILSVIDKEGGDVPVTVTYWFVWKDIHPDSDRFQSD